jgi:glucose-1-phosphate cytidylyltransferase
MEAVILCGGLGTRLREETEFKPKPMVEIGNRPILWHIMKHYRVHGIKDFVLCLGYKGDVIRDYFQNYHYRAQDMVVDLSNGAVENLNPGGPDTLDWRVTLAETGPDSLTGRRLLKALKHIKGDTFLATYGDAVANVDIDALIAAHRRSGKLATVTAVHPSSRFGELAVEGDMVRSFTEKPQINDGWINGGFFVLEKAAFEVADKVENIAFETGILEKLAAKGELAVYRHSGFWQCMDTFREMQLLNEYWDSGRAPWRTW